MSFLPKAEVPSIEDLEAVATTFVKLGVRGLRLTGGEPLVRPDILELIAILSRNRDSSALVTSP